MMKRYLLLAFCLFCFSASVSQGDQHANFIDNPYIYNGNLKPRWVSFENSSGAKGMGGMENNAAKGHPYDRLSAGETKTVLDIDGPGMINRMWITIRERTPEVLRGVVIKMYWDGEEKPAVTVPFGDFFGIGLGKTAAFENALFANAEGRSFVSYLQMPFKSHAKIEIINEMDTDVSMMFYDINLQLMDSWDQDYLYFHAYWHRDTATTMAEDFAILPKVTGKGRFLGSNISINANKQYGDAWWGEGEVKMYLDGDGEFPTLVGTGTEDYIGTAWGQGLFFHQYQGCSIADGDNKQWSYYRYHITDPVYFAEDCRVTIQQMGGTNKKAVMELIEKGVPLLPVALIDNQQVTYNLYEPGKKVDLSDPKFPGDDAWLNFYRTDDVAAVAFFYLDSPVNELPPLQDISVRIADMR
jgi:hypothetical protein